MSRELFARDPSLSLGAKKWYTVPLSIVAHVVITGIVVVIPLMATDVLPTPPGMMSAVLTVRLTEPLTIRSWETRPGGRRAEPAVWRGRMAIATTVDRRFSSRRSRAARSQVARLEEARALLTRWTMSG